MSSLDYLDLCRLCLVKDRVSVPIFEGEGDVRQIFLKIAACLPVKVAREDKLPKKICDDCVYKVELLYQFWNTTASAEKQLLQWLGDVSLDDKQGYVTGAHNQNLMKPAQNPVENRLDGSVMQQVNDHPNSMGMGMMDSMGMGMPMMITTSGQQQQSQQQQQMTSVPMDTGGNSVQNVQAVPGPSTQSTHEQIAQQKVINQSSNPEDDEDESEEDDNSDDECDGDDGLPVKEESEEDPNSSRTIEPTTFVNVSLACDEAGPSGLQQQKIGEMPEMVMPTTDGDPKSGRPVITRTKTGSPQRRVIVICRAGSSAKVPITIRPMTMSQIGRQVPIAIRPKIVPGDLAGAKVDTSPVRIIVKKTDEDSFADQASDEFSQDLRVTCPICEKRFKNENAVESHVRRVHQRPHRCTSCRASYFSQSALDEHSKTHQSNYYFECSTCHMKYKRVEGLKQHHIRAHSAEAARFVCDHCGNRYKLKLDLLLHITRAHTSAVQICRFCGKAVKDVKNHEWRHQKRARKLSFDYACKLCGRKFRTKNKHDNHLLIHKDGYSCNECGVKVSGPRQLGYHKRLKHRPGMTCPVCAKIFMSSSNFYQHVLTHARLRPYKCDVCSEDFTQRSSLLRHRRTHPGPLPPLEAPIPIADLAKNYLKEL